MDNSLAFILGYFIGAFCVAVSFWFSWNVIKKIVEDNNDN